MKVLQSLAFLIFSFWLQSSFAECSQDWYGLYCRGGGGFTLKITNEFALSNGSDLVGIFKKNPYPYSRFNGNALKPGNCSWYDRVINENEPSEFHLLIISTKMETQIGMNILTQCAPNSNCWIKLCARNSGSGYITISGGLEMSTTFGTSPP